MFKKFAQIHIAICMIILKYTSTTFARSAREQKQLCLQAPSFSSAIDMQTCQHEKDSHTSHSEFKCKGIFSAHVHGDHKDGHSLYTYDELPHMLHLTSSDYDKAKPLLFVLCEGTSTSFMKRVHQNDHGHLDGDKGKLPSSVPSLRNTEDVLQSNHDSEGSLAVSYFSMSVGVMKVLARVLPQIPLPHSFTPARQPRHPETIYTHEIIWESGLWGHSAQAINQ
jgi:hypothetical protein